MVLIKVNIVVLRFRSDHNEDNTNEVILHWLFKSSHLYHHVDFEEQSEPKRWVNESSIFQWPDERHLHIIELKEKALNFGREIWADYVFVSVAA